MRLFGNWLAETETLQRDYYGNDLAALEGEAFSQEMRVNTLASQVELAEALAEVPWKPWSVKGSGRPVPTKRDEAVIEIVDALHFIANMLILLRVTDEELSTIYSDKMQVNRDRMTSGVY